MDEIDTNLTFPHICYPKLRDQRQNSSLVVPEAPWQKTWIYLDDLAKPPTPSHALFKTLGKARQCISMVKRSLMTCSSVLSINDCMRTDSLVNCSVISVS